MSASADGRHQRHQHCCGAATTAVLTPPIEPDSLRCAIAVSAAAQAAAALPARLPGGRPAGPDWRLAPGCCAPAHAPAKPQHQRLRIHTSTVPAASSCTFFHTELLNRIRDFYLRLHQSCASRGAPAPPGCQTAAAGPAEGCRRRAGQSDLSPQRSWPLACATALASDPDSVGADDGYLISPYARLTTAACGPCSTAPQALFLSPGDVMTGRITNSQMVIHATCDPRDTTGTAGDTKFNFNLNLVSPGHGLKLSQGNNFRV
jgi:hypothetical protein